MLSRDKQWRILARIFGKSGNHFQHLVDKNISPIDVLLEQLRYLRNKKRSIVVTGYLAYNNFGDALNKYLIEELTTSKVINADCLAHNQYSEKLMAIGSVVKHADDKTVIWGSGALDEKSLPGKKVRRITSVRGKLTQQQFKRIGLGCPDVYGDPALLLPHLYNAEVPKKHTIGVLPHYIDKNSTTVQSLIAEHQAYLIDVETGPNWKRFVDDIKSCDFVLSSSLHGVIVADAYNVPNVWVEFSDKVLGQGFKFRDYYSSVGKPMKEALNLISGFSMEVILDHIKRWRPAQYSLKNLLASYPYPETIKPQYKIL